MRLASSSRKVLKSGFVILLSFQWNRNKSNKTHSYIHSVTLIHSLFFSLSHVSPVRRFKWEKKKSGFFELNPNESNTWNSYLDISAKHFPCENMRKMISKQIEAMFEAAQIAQTKYIFFSLASSVADIFHRNRNRINGPYLFNISFYWICRLQKHWQPK